MFGSVYALTWTRTWIACQCRNHKLPQYCYVASSNITPYILGYQTIMYKLRTFPKFPYTNFCVTGANFTNFLFACLQCNNNTEVVIQTSMKKPSISNNLNRHRSKTLTLKHCLGLLGPHSIVDCHINEIKNNKCDFKQSRCWLGIPKIWWTTWNWL